MTSISRMVVVLATLTASGASAQRIELAHPDHRAELVVRVSYATIEVLGAERSDIEIEVRAGQTGAVGALQVPVTAQGNRVEIVHPGNDSPVDLRIEVPRRSDLFLESSNGGPIRVAGIRGALEIVNSNAGVTLSGIDGTAVVSTSNGAIRAELVRVDPESAAISLVTSNDAIELALPAGFEGRILAESDTGPVESELEVLPDPSVSGEVRRGGRVLSGRVGSGDGPLVRLRTENAAIRITKVTTEGR